MFRAKIASIIFLVLLVSSIVHCIPRPDDTEYTRVRIHVPHHIHKHTHTIVKKIYIPVKQKHHSHKLIEDAW